MLQPFEVKIKEEGHSLRIQYDLLRGIYKPSHLHGEYSEEEINVIKEHINLFGLNEPERKNFEIGKFCKNVIDNKSFMQGYEYNNLVVNLFREKLQVLDMEEAIKVCKVIYGNAFLQLAT